MESFNKYVGVQGVIAILLVIGYIVSIFLAVTLPPSYDALMTLVLGFYFGKNGIGLIAALRGVPGSNPKE